MIKKELTRRKFIQITSATGAFLALGCVPDSRGEQVIAKMGEEDTFGLNQFIRIGTDNRVVLFSHRPEMGQGTYQSVPMVLAEELEVDIRSIEIRPSPANRELYGNQMVVGSRSMQTEYENLRKMGASAREMLRETAASRWKVPVETCRAENGKVFHSNGMSLSYGELVEEASRRAVPKNIVLKDPKEFKVIGKSIPRQDIPLKTNGEAIFGIDVVVSGMVYACVERSPVFLGKVLSFNEEEVMKVKGVKMVLRTQRQVWGHEREGVAVLADSYWAALQGRKILKVNWDNSHIQLNDSEMLWDDYRRAGKGKGDILHKNGDPENIFRQGNKIIEASYETPYQSHAPIEPMNATVWVSEGKAEFWGSTQNPNGVRSALARQLDIPEEKVTVHYTFMGGAFGRRSMTDVAEEAADLAKKSGLAVKVIWTREDDITQGPFRACSLNICRGMLDPKGNLLALEHKVVAQEIQNQTGNSDKAGNQLMGGINSDYAIPNFMVKGVLRKHAVPITYWRSVYHSTNTFAHESFIDELAYRGKKDPLDFRLSMLTEHPRFTGVLKKVAEMSNWYKKEKGVGYGVAIVERSGAYIAMVVTAVKKMGKVIPVKVLTAVDVGICIHPDTVIAQTEGSVVMALSAVYQGLTLKEGAIVEKNYDTYKLLKIGDTPEMETFVMESIEPPDGAGEAGLPTLAPALASAIFDLTGERKRKLPF